MNSALSLPEETNKPYTIPVLNQGRPVTSIPKGSNKLTEQAKRKWFIEFHFYDEYSSKMVRMRVSKQLNRVKDPHEKLAAFVKLQASYTKALETGWKPLDIKANQNLSRKILSITLEQGKAQFIEYHKGKGTRPTTIRSYLSKINMFIEHLGNIKVNQVTDYEITDFLNTYERKKQWTGVTYNYAKISLNNLFKFLILYKYLSHNPLNNLERRKEIKTESHKVFSDKDFVLIMEWLRANDPYSLLFIQMIYYTCIRPKELRNTRLKFIDLERNIITIPAFISKNKKAIPVKIDPALKKELIKLKLNDYPDDYFLFGDTKNIIGKFMIGENTPYNRFQRCLRELNLLGKNYTLYSFKHMSNVKKYLAGWSIAEICSANRHSSLVETETYLKDLMQFIPTTKEIPEI